VQELEEVPNLLKKTFVSPKSLKIMVSVGSGLHPRSYMDSVPWLEQPFLNPAQKENKQAWFSGEGDQPQMFPFQVKPNCKGKRQKTPQSPSHRKRDSNFTSSKFAARLNFSAQSTLPFSHCGRAGCLPPQDREDQLLQRFFSPPCAGHMLC